MELFNALLLLLVATRAGAEVAVRLGQAALVGGLIAGIVLGLPAPLFDSAFPILTELPDDEVFHAISDLGIFFLMLCGGIELQPKKLTKDTRAAIWVAVGGMTLPLALGGGLGWLVLPPSPLKPAQTLFLGVALAVTAIPMAVKALMDLGRLNTKAGRIIVSAAIVDDILSLILLTVLTAMISTGTAPSFGEMGTMGLQVVGFFGVSTVLGVYGLPRMSRLIKRATSSEFAFGSLLILALAEALLAEALGLHFILGAFLAGLFFSGRTPDPATFRAVKTRMSAVTSGFLAPVFFASIGFSLTFESVFETPVFLATVVIIAVAGKLLGAGLPARWTGLENRDAAAVGMGMVGRGAVELVIADIALRGGLFSAPEPVPPIVATLFPTVVLMAIVTTVFAPIGLRLIWSSEAKSGRS